jgi:hypothetical protein
MTVPFVVLSALLLPGMAPLPLLLLSPLPPLLLLLLLGASAMARMHTGDACRERMDAVPAWSMEGQHARVCAGTGAGMRAQCPDKALARVSACISCAWAGCQRAARTAAIMVHLHAS